MKRQDDFPASHSERRAKARSEESLQTHLAYIGIGSNLGNRLKNCTDAVNKINIHPEINVTKVSSWIETDPIGYIDQPKFINGAIEIKTSLSPVELLQALKQIEKEIGREKTFRWGPRTIDLDLLLYDSLTLKSDELTLPHPHIQDRDFVKIPLLEINPILQNEFSGI